MLTSRETNKHDFGDQLAPSNTSKYSYIFEEEMRWISLQRLPSGEIATTEGISSIPLNHYSINLDKRCFNTSFKCLHELLQVPKL